MREINTDMGDQLNLQRKSGILSQLDFRKTTFAVQVVLLDYGKTMHNDDYLTHNYSFSVSPKIVC